MMGVLRTISNSGFVLKIVILLIILMILVTGIGTTIVGNSSNNDYAIMINGHKISMLQYEQALLFAAHYQQQLFGREFTELVSHDNYMEQFRKQVLFQLRDEFLLQQYVHHLGMDISDEQIKKNIFNQPNFQVKGQFDYTKYMKILNSMGLTSNQYAELLRNQLTINQLLFAIKETYFLLPREKDVLTALITQERVVRKAVMNMSAIAAHQLVSEKEIKQHYQQNINYFILPEQFRVTYKKLDIKKLPKPHVSNIEIQNWYDLHKSDYLQARRKEYCIFKLKNEKEAIFLLKELKNAGNFGSLAKIKSRDEISRSAARIGGKRELIDPKYIPDEVKKAHLQKKGQISGIIKSPVGNLIIRLDNIQSEKLIPLKMVRTNIAHKIEQEKKLDIYYKLQKKMRETTNQFKYNNAVGWRTVETEWFNIHNIPEELNYNAVKKIIFKTTARQLKKSSINAYVVTVDSNHCHYIFVINFIHHRPAIVKPLHSVRNNITVQIKRQKAEQQIKLELNNLIFNVGDKAKKRLGLHFGKAIVLTRESPDNITDTVFSLKPPEENHVSYGFRKNIQGNIVIIELDEVRNRKPSNVQEKLIVKSITQNKINLIIISLLDNLRKNSNIKYGVIV